MNAVSPTISIIIPYLNQSDHLCNCLSSLTGQNFDLTKVEIIVVDNGSRELPVEICQRFNSVQLASEETPGPGPARNQGIRISKAPILAFIDADCIADQNWLKAIADAFNDQHIHVIGGDVRIAVTDPNRITMLEAYESIYAYRQKEYIERQGFSGTGNLAVRRATFEKVGPFAGIDVAEDREWGQRATAKGILIAYRPEMKVFHPARKSFAELCAKWDRHLSHDYRDQVQGAMSGLRWFVKALGLAVSPLWELHRILTSKRVTSVRHRILALAMLCRIRIYRAKQMLSQLVWTDSAINSSNWNRSA